ncbi:hypothetical protein ACLKA6_014059 [Drosophila palustris]
MIHVDSEEDYNNTYEIPNITKPNSINEIPNTDLDQHIFRTQLLVLDYKQFKAARHIQRYFRGWKVRHLNRKQKRAAVIIQRAWRKHLTRRNLVINFQNRTQSMILMTYNLSSIKIQALYRGWWSRKHINNMIYLKNIQLNAVEDILHCLSYELHKIKRNEKIPGLLSMRQGNCLRKVEELVSTLTYRLYNRYVEARWIHAKANQEKHRTDFANSVFYTAVPFYGNDDINYCTPPPSPTGVKNYKSRECDFTQAFREANRSVQEHKVKQPIHKYRNRYIMEKGLRCRLFCKELICGMKHWKIGDEYKLNIPDDIFNGNLQEFIMDLKGYLEALHYVENCNCLRGKKNTDPLAPDLSLQ